MARPLRIQYPGAVYHAMARGDGGRNVFDNDDDRRSFLNLLEKTCERYQWRIHAYVLMGNHFHLLLETPEPNLVEGMRWLMGVFSQAWNRRRKRRGHVFQGRYKAILVSHENKSDGYFRVVADYIHLNPVRIGWVGGDGGLKLKSYRWSSFPFYGHSKPPKCLLTERVLEEFGLSASTKGGKSYSSYLEARAISGKAVENDESLTALRRGWYVGANSFKEKLLGIINKAEPSSKPENLSGGAATSRNQFDAEMIARRALAELGLPRSVEDLRGWGLFVKEKNIVIALLRKHTSANNRWIADRLGLGHSSRIPASARKVRESTELSRRMKDLEEIVIFKDWHLSFTDECATRLDCREVGDGDEALRE